MSRWNDSVASRRWRPSTQCSSAAGINSLASAPRCSRARAGASAVLERNDRLGGCDPHRRRPHRARLHARGAVVVAPALRRARRRTPSWPTSSRATGVEYLNTEHADGVAVPRRLGRVPHDLARAERRRARAPRARRRRGLGAPVRGVHALRRPQLRRALGRAVVAAGPRARRARPIAGSVAAGCSRSPATRSSSARDWLEATFASDAARGLLAPWVLHTGLGPEQAVSGFMTQVIGCAIQLGGMPVPRGGGIRLVEALAAIVREGRRRAAHRAPTSSACSSAAAARPASGSSAARRRRRLAR